VQHGIIVEVSSAGMHSSSLSHHMTCNTEIQNLTLIQRIIMPSCDKAFTHSLPSYGRFNKEQ